MSLQQLELSALHFLTPASFFLLVAGVLFILVDLQTWRARSCENQEMARALHQSLHASIETVTDTKWELCDNEACYRDLLDHQEDIILRRDDQGRSIFVNSAFARVFGLESAAVLGRPFAPEVIEGETPGPLSDLKASQRRRYVQFIVTASGPRWFAWEDQLVRGDASISRQFEVQTLGRDITEQRNLELAMQHARDQAEATSEAKSRFLAVMSHEIRTPLNGIMGMTGLLLETDLSQEQQSYAQTIEQSSKSLHQLINEILDFSKIEAEKVILHNSPFELDVVLQNVVELLAPRAHDKGLEIAWSIRPDAPKVIIADEMRFRQIVMNLLGNAIKFTEKGGVSIRVSAHRAHGPTPHKIQDQVCGDQMKPDESRHMRLTMEVRDTGIGLKEEALDAIFCEFEQADSTSTRRYGGTGLGLAICKRLAVHMGGDITVTSEFGVGSTFRAEIEVGRDEVDGTLGQTWRSQCAAKRVLVVSEACIEAELLGDLLMGLGHYARHVSPREALEMVEQHSRRHTPFDTVLITTQISPRLAERLIKRMRSLAGKDGFRAVVLITAAERRMLAEWRGYGFDAYLVRPVRPASLLAQIASLDTVATTQPQVIGQQTPVAEVQGGKTTPCGSRVLVAEDNDVNALLACRMMKRLGLEVIRAHNGIEAVEQVVASMKPGALRFNLVFMDMHMPEMDGLEATREIVRKFMDKPKLSAPPIIALTANAFAEDRSRCLNAGMVDHIAKPFELHQLEDVLCKWCGRDHMARHDGTFEEINV